MFTYQTIGFALSNRDFREADKFFSIYTDTHGKIEVLAAGVRKIQSKLRAHLEPFSVVNLMIARGRHYDRLIGAVQQKNYEKIKSNYNLLIINYQLLEIIDQLAKPNHPDPRIFNLLKEVFDFLEIPYPLDQRGNNVTMKQCNSETIESLPALLNSIYSYFTLKLLSYLGYTPELKLCVRCKGSVSSPAYFNFQDGGIVCRKCATNNDCQILSESIDVLKKYLTKDLRSCFKFSNGESCKLAEDFLNYHLDHPLKSGEKVFHDREILSNP